MLHMANKAWQSLGELCVPPSIPITFCSPSLWFSAALCGYKIFLTISSSVFFLFFEILKRNWKKIVIDQVRIHDQLGICSEGVVDVANATIQEAKFVFKWIACLNAFVGNEQWSVIRMKVEFLPQFTTILQITYQRQWLVYFSNHIAITFDKVNTT